MAVPNFLLICAALGQPVGVFLSPTMAGMTLSSRPLVGLFLAFLPIMWLLMRRKRRLRNSPPIARKPLS